MLLKKMFSDVRKFHQCLFIPKVTFILMILLSPVITTDANSDESTPFTLLDSEGNKAEPGHLGLLLYNGGTVCGNSFSETAADAICKYMGYISATGWTSQVESFEVRYGLEIKVSNVQCSSADWNDCNFTEEHDCIHTQDVFLSCSYQLMYGESEEETTVFTMVDHYGDESEEIDTYRYGLLLYRGGTVCSDNFDSMAANAICGYMGYNSALDWEGGEFYPDIQDNLNINLGNVRCSSTDWETCNFSEEPNCDHSQDVFLVCYGREETEDGSDDNEISPFSLVDSEGNEIEEGEGLLLYRGGTVCDDSFNDIAAEAICRYMEYSYSTGWTSEREITEFRESLEITLDDVECSSADWNSCDFSEEDNCSHSEDVFLSCSYGEDAGDTSDFKLVDSEGNEIEEGEGLLLYRGGTVCDDSFNDIAAEAICRYMEYSYSTGWTSDNYVTEFRESLEITLDDVECSSADWNSCTFSEEDNCSHSEDVFLSCSYGEDAGDASDFKLVDSEGNEIEEGEGLLLYRGGTVCDDRFNDIAAEAICLYMEYSYSIGWTSAKDITEFRETLEITLDDVECSSAYWNSCTFSEKNDCGHGEDVFLTCGKDAEDASDFTLVDSGGDELEEGQGEGLLLYRGGTVCDDGFDDRAAKAICKSMGYTQSLSWGSGLRFSMQEQYSIYLDDVKCSTSEWKGCTFLAYEHNCDHGEDIFLACKTGVYWLTIGDQKIKMVLIYKYEQ